LEKIESLSLPAMLSLAIILLSLSAVLGARVPDSQRQALVKVLQALQCASPVCTGNVDDTLRATDFCPSNQGVVRCNGNGDVTGIDVRGCAVGQTGSLASEIGVLTDLQFLLVFANGERGTCTLQGSLPNMATLTQLGDLELQGSFSGSLPAFFGSSTSLTRLALTDNNFSSVFQFTQQSKLQELRIENNPNLAGNLGLLPPTLTRLWMQNSVVTANFSALTTPFAPLGRVAPGEEAACQLSQRYTCGNCTPALLNCKCGSNTFCTTAATTATTTTTTEPTPTSTVVTTTATAQVQPAVTPTTSPSTSFPTSASTTTTGATTVPPATSTATNTSATALLPTASSSPSSSGPLESWLVGVIVGGAVLALLLVGVGVFCLVKHRRTQESPADRPAAATEMKQPLPASQYAPIAPAEYGQGRIDPSNYDVIPGQASASDYNVGRVQ
jgi:hypothetical protein